MRLSILLVISIIFSQPLAAQELFPIADLASSVPKSTLGIRLFGEGYQEKNVIRNLTGLKLLYGLTPKLSVSLAITASDIHEKTLPFDFISHDHSGGQLVSGTNTPAAGIPYPMIYNGADIYAKYRFVSIDGTNTHYRTAVYAEGSHVVVPSHEAEPDLLVHTSGFGAGLINTYLHHHFATSLTTGFILPAVYKGNTYDRYGGVYPTTIHYGNALTYSLSFGYLLFPREFKNYSQTNVSIYCEFTGKWYGAAKIREQDGPISGALIYDLPVTTPILQGAAYLDINPGIQFIINSVYRIDASVGLPLVNRSYNHLYPLFLLGIQRYIYF